MNRFWVVLIFAGLIFWQSSCLEFRDGMIINRCGLWQKVTGGAVVLAMREPKDRVQEVIGVVPVETPSKPPEGSSSVCINASGGVCVNGGAVTPQTYAPPAPNAPTPAQIREMIADQMRAVTATPGPLITISPNTSQPLRYYGAVTMQMMGPEDFYDRNESYRNGRYR